jgi:gluconate 2-dehydrogenase gamma chain
MANETHDGEGAAPKVSRRNLFKQAALAGAAVALPGAAVTSPVAAQPTGPSGTPGPEALETLTAVEADILEAIVARLIPTDENGPGGTEARAAHYIDRALAGPLRASRPAYATGLAALDDYAQSTKGASFAKLSAKDQDAVLSDLEMNAATGFAPDSAAFFNLVRTHAIEGTFCDPYYGGNANFVGWNMVGYPGIRVVVSEDEQRMSPKPSPLRKSAYDNPMFTLKGGGHGHQP